MAFITLEDSIAEIEVIIFSKQYSRFAAETGEENAVTIEGRISFEEGEAPKVILSSITPLISNAAFEADTGKPKEPERIFVKLNRFSEELIAPIYRLANLHSGRVPIAIFDASSRKYVSLKNITMNANDAALTALRRVFGEDNVVVK